MKLSKKDQLILTLVLPAAIVGMYVFFWSRPALKSVNELRARVSQLGSEEQQAMVNERLLGEYRILQKRLAEVISSNQVEEAAHSLPAPGAASGLKQLQELCQQSNLRLVSANVQDQDLSKDANSLHKIYQQMGWGQVNVWHVTVQASYSDVMQFLQTCSKEKHPITVKTLSMRSVAGTSPTFYWSMQVCL